jgi:hypothetical protein
MSVKSQHIRTRRRGLTGSSSQFKPGDSVYHSRLGVGTIVAEWGYWTDLDPEHGNELIVNGAKIFDVEFRDSGRRSVNAERLIPATALDGDGRELAKRISHYRLFV